MSRSKIRNLKSENFSWKFLIALVSKYVSSKSLGLTGKKTKTRVAWLDYTVLLIMIMYRYWPVVVRMIVVNSILWVVMLTYLEK